jgi:predicted transcriptional regulator
MNKLSEEDIQELLRLRAEGWHYERLAQAFGVTHAAISYHLKKNRIMGRIKQKEFIKKNEKKVKRYVDYLREYTDREERKHKRNPFNKNY